MKNPQLPTTPLRLAVIDAPPRILRFPVARNDSRREPPRGRGPQHAATAPQSAALSQMRTRLYRMIVENERGRTHGNRAS